MMKTAFKIIGATAIVAGAYLYSRKETPEEFVQRAKTSFEDKNRKLQIGKQLIRILKTQWINLRANCLPWKNNFRHSTRYR